VEGTYNTGIAIQAGLQMIAGASGLTVKHCRFENINLGIVTSYSGSRDFTITDSRGGARLTCS